MTGPWEPCPWHETDETEPCPCDGGDPEPCACDALHDDEPEGCCTCPCHPEPGLELE